MEYGTLLLATLEPCWLWWLILSALAFILGALLGCLLCGNKKKLQELETENAALLARANNWEKDYVGLKYQHEQTEAALKEARARLNSCEADNRVLKSKLEKQKGEGDFALGAAAPVTVPSSSEGEDLKIIEGIGPKIEALLKEEGILSWQNVADASVEHLRGILSNAGGHFRLAQPDTWPRQAALAAAGEWEALTKLQDELQGGVDKG
ncbi:MAG: hypothetical protein RIC19_17785 [Phaeodactylibacter sp.]|uniref:hypothetical protein n=1 Tax=Phaeodactylibacter sp. TaxID=1940289 RepID=UPI0032EB7192